MDRDQLALRNEWLPTCDRKAIEHSHRSFEEEDIHKLLPDIRCETFMIYAQKGGTVREEDADEIVGAIPSASCVRIDGVGHMIPWTTSTPSLPLFAVLLMHPLRTNHARTAPSPRHDTTRSHNAAHMEKSENLL